LSCAQADELLGAYALDALTAPEAMDVQAHLDSCAEHRQAASELRHTASLLALAVDERDPSPELRDRVIQSIRSASPEPFDTAAAVPAVVSTRPAPRLPRWAPRPEWAAMAAAVLLAIGVGTFAGYRIGHGSGPGNSQPVAYHFSGSLLAPTARASLVYLPDRHEALLAVNGLPPLAPGQVYEMWLVDKRGLPSDRGVALAADGKIAVQMDADLSSYRQFAITIEPGERQAPTTQPILEGNLQGTSA
jgi:anti-sigma-K factor RskA